MSNKRISNGLFCRRRLNSLKNDNTPSHNKPVNFILVLFNFYITDNLGAEITETLWKFARYRYNSNHIACSGLHEFMCQSRAVRILIG